MAIKPLVERGAIHKIRLYLSLQKTLQNVLSTPGNKSAVGNQVPASPLLWEKGVFHSFAKTVCSEHCHFSCYSTYPYSSYEEEWREQLLLTSPKPGRAPPGVKRARLAGTLSNMV